MVRVVVRRDSRNQLSSLFAHGHAGWADAGTDIVCSAVSAILQAAWLGLERVASVPVEGKKDDGTLTLSWPEETRTNPALEAIVTTAELAIEQIGAQYPRHVSLSRETEH